jgi:uncharacterized protein YwqG
MVPGELVSDRDRPRSRDEVETLIGVHFPEDANIISSVLLPAITFVQAPRADGRVALRLGGSPPLPSSLKWPVNDDRELFFVGAVDLTVVGSLDVTEALPTSGSLLFFYDIVSQSWGLDALDTAPWRVLYIEDDNAQHLPRRDRRPHPTDSQYMFQSFINPGEIHDAAPTWTMPMSSEPCVSVTTYGTAHGDDYFARLRGFTAIDDSCPMGFQMLGWPFYRQPNSRQWRVAAASSGKSRDEITEVEVAEWRLLMQFPKWDEYGGTNWGGPGGGMLEYWIRDADLRARRFDQVWIQMDA